MVALDVTDKRNPKFLGRVDFGDFGSFLGVHSAVPIPDTDLVAVNTEAIEEVSPLKGGDPLNFTCLVDVSELTSPEFQPPGEDEIGGHPSGMKIVSVVPEPEPEADLPYVNYHEKPGRYGPHNQHHYRLRESSYRSAERLVMAYFNAGLRIFDISDPLLIKEVGYYVPDDPEEKVGASPQAGAVTQMDNVTIDARGNMFCLDKNQGLFVLESPLI